MGEVNFTNYFNSESFLEAISPFRDYFLAENNYLGGIGFIVDVSIKYAILMGNGYDLNVDGLNSFVNDVCKKIDSIYQKGPIYTLSSNYELNDFVNGFLVNKLLDKYGMSRIDMDDDSKKKVAFKHILKNFLGNERKYHAFNSGSLEGIKEFGLDPKQKLTLQKDIDNINNIFCRYGINNIFGWQKLNCENKVFYSARPNEAYYYGVYSPEWFSQFVGAGFPYNPNTMYKKNAFGVRDYDAAKDNLLKLMKKVNFLEEDITIVMDFFEVEWGKYGKTRPMLAIIPGKGIEEKTEKFWDMWFADDSPFSFKNSIDNLLSFCMGCGSVDIGTSDVIDTSDATYIELPEMAKVMEYIINENKENVDDSVYTKEEFDDKYRKLLSCRIAVNDGDNSENVIYTSPDSSELEFFLKLRQDEKFFNSLVKYLDDNDLSNFFRMYGQHLANNILMNEDNLKKIALLAPEVFNRFPDQIIDDKELMCACAKQVGIKPVFLCFASPRLRNDLDFVVSIINSSNEKTFDFYGKSSSSLDGSAMRYGQIIGLDVQKNPMFWDCLNMKIKNLNEKTETIRPYFDKEIEMGIINSINIGSSNLDKDKRIVI